MENYTKINKMEDLRRAIKNIHKEVSGPALPDFKTAATLPAGG